MTKVFKQWGGRQPKCAKHIDVSYDEGDDEEDADADADDGCTKPWRNGRPKWARKARVEEQRERDQSAGDRNAGGNEVEDEDEDIIEIVEPASPTEEDTVHW